MAQMRLNSEFGEILLDVGDKRQDSDCACSRVAPCLPALGSAVEEAVLVGPSSAQYNGLSHLISLLCAGLLSGSHSLDAQQSVLEAFEMYWSTGATWGWMMSLPAIS